MKPIATIGISFRNPGKYFELAVKSVFAQSFPDWELILVDDGSTDGSVEFARSLDDERVRVLVDGRELNLNVRLNQMIDLARAPYFFRMDADDIMHPDRLLKQLALLESSDEKTVTGSAYYAIDQNSRVVNLRGVCRRQYYGFAARHSFAHPSVAASTAWFRKHRYSESFLFHRSQDAELWCRTSASSRFVWLSEPLLFYRQIGVFSVDKHLGTMMGVLALARVYNNDSRMRCLAVLARELLRLYCRLGLDLLGITYLPERWIHKAIDPSAQETAQRIVDEIARLELPLRVLTTGERRRLIGAIPVNAVDAGS